jgi:hypothetical protein
VGLLALRRAHAAKVKRQERIVMLAVRELVEIHASMDRGASAMAGDDYEVCHTVSFERHCSMDEQREDLCEVLILGLVDSRPWSRTWPTHLSLQVINGSEPMQNDQTYFFSDIFLKIYNIIKIMI